MTGQQLVDQLKARGLGEHKLKLARDYVKTHPADPAERVFEEFTEYGHPKEGGWQVSTIIVAREIMEQDGSKKSVG